MLLMTRRLCGLAPVLMLLGAIGVLALACGGEEEAVERAPSRPQPESTAPAQAEQPAVAVAPAPAEPGAPVKQRELPESAFVETDENRDPFRSYIQVFNLVAAISPEELEPRQPVILEEHELDALRLIAIVSGEGGNPRAMLVDPDGKGWVIRRGDFVGRGERIRLGPGQPEREINWRVVRIRPDRVILVRDDPVQMGPQVTHVLRLYPEEET
jgi:type IV pilus assembly protein PilP